jgi:hypothetical protein
MKALIFSRFRRRGVQLNAPAMNALLVPAQRGKPLSHLVLRRIPCFSLRPKTDALPVEISYPLECRAVIH